MTLRAWCVAVALSGCATTARSDRQPVPLVVKGQPVPILAVEADRHDFKVPESVAVLHYYGSGGWGIQWGHTYLLTAPYFSNHALAELLASETLPGLKLKPNLDLVRAGFAGTPVEKTSAILIGHGHVDHTGDVASFFETGLIEGRPVLIADRSTTNQLAALQGHFSCVAPIDYDNDEEVSVQCPLPNVRITALHHAHAPHLKLVGLEVAAYGGFVKAPREVAPERPADFKLGNTWAYLIDLLDEKGQVAFRIHYVDAAASPPHGMVPKKLLAQRDVDVHIACVPGFEQSDFYPEALIEHQRVHYVLAGHWEDFFQPQTEPLKPLTQVLDEAAMNRFVASVEASLPAAGRLTPLHKTLGPHGNGWALPVPGETFQFDTAP